MTLFADDSPLESEPSVQNRNLLTSQVLGSVNNMVAVWGIVARVALQSLAEQEQSRITRSAKVGNFPAVSAPANREPEGDEISIEDLFEQAISTLGLSRDEVIDLWDLFLSATASAEKHYWKLVEEGRQKEQQSTAGSETSGRAVRVNSRSRGRV